MRFWRDSSGQLSFITKEAEDKIQKFDKLMKESMKV
jgi:hypothetical protein